METNISEKMDYVEKKIREGMKKHIGQCRELSDEEKRDYIIKMLNSAKAQGMIKGWIERGNFLYDIQICFPIFPILQIDLKEAII